MNILEKENIKKLMADVETAAWDMANDCARDAEVDYFRHALKQLAEVAFKEGKEWKEE
jgi:hypothetical protein